MAMARWIGVGAALATAAFGQVPARQQAYNAAQAAFDASNWQAAADGFAPLLAREGRSSRTDGVIRARYAWTLRMLDQQEEAEAQALRATGEFPGEARDEQRADAWLTLAKVRRSALALDTARDALEEGLKAVPPGSPLWLEIQTMLMGVTLTVEPARAFAAAGEIAASNVFATMTKDQQAQVIAYQALARLNGRDAPAALALVRRAISLTGGLQSNNVDLVQAIVRSDAALIMLRAGHADEAREALAHAGGGYMPSSGWLGGDGQNDLPVCDDDVRPEDVAVVEFFVGDDGAVTSALPIFASRPGKIGTVFAAKVYDWRFAPETIAKVKPFWRSAVRLELRCITRPASLALSRAFDEAASRWLTGQGIPVSGKTLQTEKAALPTSASPAIVALADTLHRAAAPKKQHPASPQEVDTALAAAGAPAEVRAAFAYRNVGYSGSRIGSAGSRAAAFAKLADQFAALPDGVGAAAWFEVETALALETGGDFAEARPRLDRALATPVGVLPEGDPIRVVATLHRALVDRKLGDAAAADTRLRTAGLNQEQCSLFDVRPLPVRESAGSSDFPTEALRWAMEGFAQTAFDISADGKVAKPRTVKAYPPFVFGPGSEKIVARFRYLPPTLNNVVLGCSAMNRTFNFKVPGRPD